MDPLDVKRLISVPPIQACCQNAWCLACVELCPLGREGPRFIILMRQQMNQQTQLIIGIGAAHAGAPAVYYMGSV